MKNRIALPQFVAPLFCWLIGLWLSFYPTFLSRFSLIQGDLGDTRFNNYVLEHSFRWVMREPGHQSFWNFPFYFPVENVGTYGDILLGVAPIYWIFRFAQFAPDTSFQLWQITVVTLNYVAFYYLLRHIFNLTWWACGLGAFLFAFASPRMVHFLHPQFLPQFYSIIVLYFAGKLALAVHRREQRTGWQLTIWMSVACLAFVLQWYSSFYYGWLLTFSLGVAAVWAILIKRSRLFCLQMARRYWLQGSLAAVSGAALLYPMAKRYHDAAKELGLREFGHVHRFLPRPAGWLYMGKESSVYGWFSELSLFSQLPLDHEQQLGLGICTIAIVALGFWRSRKNTTSTIVALTALSLVVVSTVLPNGHSLWSYIYLNVPGAAAVRAVSRIQLVLLIGWSFGFALFFDRQLISYNSSKPVLIGFAIAALCMFEQSRISYTYSKPEMRRQVQILTSGLAASSSTCRSFYYSSWLGQREPWKYQLDAMWASIESGIPTINGYSGNSPPGWNLSDNRISNRNDLIHIGRSLKKWASDRKVPLSESCWLRRYRTEGNQFKFEGRPIK